MITKIIVITTYKQKNLLYFFSVLKQILLHYFNE